MPFASGSGSFASLEAAIGRSLPDDFRALHDDRRDTPNGLEMLCPEAMLGEWNSWAPIADSPDNPEPDPVHGVRASWWTRGWIPFALLYGSSDYLCVDLDPGEGGAVGQIIHASPKMGPMRLLAPDYGAFRARLIAVIAAGAEDLSAILEPHVGVVD